MKICALPRARKLNQRNPRHAATSIPLKTPKISFHAAGGRTQLALAGTDRPGLLAAVAQVMLSEDVRVHDARIATFGERVEDFFLLTDRANAPLDAQHQQRLLQALLARIGPARE